MGRRPPRRLRPRHDAGGRTVTGGPVVVAIGPLEVAAGPVVVAIGPLEVACGPVAVTIGPLEVRGGSLEATSGPLGVLFDRKIRRSGRLECRHPLQTF
jgi:hypothetical protein